MQNENDVIEIQSAWLDRYGEPPEVATNLLQFAYLRTRAQEQGITEIQALKVHGFGKPKWNIRISPISLRPSQKVRTTRVYEHSIYKEEQKELFLRIPEIEKAAEELIIFLDGLSSKG